MFNEKAIKKYNFTIAKDLRKPTDAESLGVRYRESGNMMSRPLYLSAIYGKSILR